MCYRQPCQPQQLEIMNRRQTNIRQRKDGVYRGAYTWKVSELAMVFEFKKKVKGICRVINFLPFIYYLHLLQQGLATSAYTISYHLYGNSTPMPQYVRLLLYLKFTFSQFLTRSVHLPVPISQREGPSSRAPLGLPTAGTLHATDYPISSNPYRHAPTHFSPSDLYLLFLLTWTKLLTIKQNGRFETNF